MIARLPNKKPRPTLGVSKPGLPGLAGPFPIGGVTKLSTVRRGRKIGNLGQSVVSELLHANKFALSAHPEKILFSGNPVAALSVRPNMARLFQKPPIRPRDLFEDFVERRGDLQARRSSNVKLVRRGPSRQRPTFVVKAIAWLLCLMMATIIWFAAWGIIGQLTMYWL
jgi:hypothetical protein